MTDIELSPEAQKILEDASGFTREPEFLRDMARRDATRDTMYRTCEDYYSGENQRTRLTDRVKRYLQQSGFLWCENFCEVVVDAMCERMILTNVASEDETVNQWADELWKSSRMDTIQSIVHMNTAVKGDGFVIVDWDSRTGQPFIHWNRPEIIKPVYDSEHPDDMLFAAKVWKSRLEAPTNPNKMAIMRMNLYFPDRIEKWFNAAPDGQGDWAKHLDPSDTEWPVSWLDSKGEPLGVPVFHFRNKSKGKAYGVSEIRGTIPQQDGLNKQILDLHMIVDQQGAPQRYGTGIKKDERSSMTGSAGTLWTANSPDAKFGQFDAADVSGILSCIEASIQRLAGRSRTPLFLLVLAGDAPSGESLKTALSGLVAKVKDRRVSVGDRWEDVFVMCAKVAQTEGHLPGVDVTLDLFDAVWIDPESRNEVDQATALGTMVGQLGLSKHTALTELGYDPDEERVWKDEETASAVTNFNGGVPTLPIGNPTVTPVVAPATNGQTVASVGTTNG